ncbi:MAG: H-type lectin domain-containing protein, partial [Bacteroidia bacterium]|nr:H-type lectin domain-containing protein [Bacteroidia bacterium]
GPSIYASKNAGQAGIAARFDILNTTNTADAVFSKTEGSGAALHAVSSATNNSSALALLVENGHIATSGAQPSIAVSTASLTAFSLSGNSTDVAGVINFSNFSGGTIPAGSVIVTITFSKPYSATPVVILTAANLQAGGDAVYVSGVTTAGFELRYNSNMAIGGRVFNYMVIETK